ncbi:MAG: hypothetical protein BWY45_01633 [Euryarchaeota archaeon ADurb.Bin294]|nr:MAG: hypothetical protein BWY45_01633 [Euryarchaeota archaeon ADurb.Bin294]
MNDRGRTSNGGHYSRSGSPLTVDISIVIQFPGIASSDYGSRGWRHSGYNNWCCRSDHGCTCNGGHYSRSGSPLTVDIGFVIQFPGIASSDYGSRGWRHSGYNNWCCRSDHGCTCNGGHYSRSGSPLTVDIGFVIQFPGIASSDYGSRGWRHSGYNNWCCRSDHGCTCNGGHYSRSGSPLTVDIGFVIQFPGIASSDYGSRGWRHSGYNNWCCSCDHRCTCNGGHYGRSGSPLTVDIGFVIEFPGIPSSDFGSRCWRHSGFSNWCCRSDHWTDRYNWLDNGGLFGFWFLFLVFIWQ